MADDFWIHVSTRLPHGVDTARARDLLLSGLRDEGLDDMVRPPASAGVARHQGLDGAPRLVCGSTHPVALHGDEEAFARRLGAAIELRFTVAGIRARASVVLRHVGEGEAERFHAALLHQLDSHLGEALEAARDRMSPELFGPLSQRYAELETWEQRAELIFLCGPKPSATLAPIWRDLLLSPIETPAHVCGLHLALQTAIHGLESLAGGGKVDFGSDEEQAKRLIDRVREHLRSGGDFPAPGASLRDDDEDLDVFAQLARDAAPGVRTADIDELLLAINDAPVDDAPRRAIADAIRARNPGRARLVDLGLEIAAHHRYGRAAPEALEREERALLAAHGRAWAGPLAKVARAYVFRRGFVEDLTLDADAVDAFTKPGSGPFSNVPGEPRFGLFESCALLDLQLDRAAGRIPQLLNRLPFTGLRSLRLPAQGLTDDDAVALASCASLGRLRGLDLRANQIGWRGLRALAAAFRNLRWLDFSANAVGDPAASDEAPEAGLSDTGRRLVSELGPLPWLEDPLRRADGSTPYPEQL